MRDCFVIPTYWSTPEIDSWKTFDHPTPIEEEGTIKTTLKNFEENKYEIPVLLFPAPTHPAIEARVKELSKGYKLNLHVFSGEELDKLKKLFLDKGFPQEFIGDIHMNSYGGIRNMGLIYANLMGYDNVIQIDDDEIIEDPEYLQKATGNIGTDWHGEKILGKTGYYLDANNKAFYDGQLKFEYKNWPKDRLFNQDIKESLEDPNPLHPTIGAVGGNMVVNKEMYQKIAYDPYSTRGEDDDYAINALAKGMHFLFDKALWIKHLPPSRHKAYWTRNRQDIIRFKYFREKIQMYGFTPEQMGCFIGHFIQENLEYLAVSSSIHAAKHFLAEGKMEDFEGFLGNAELALELDRKEMRKTAEKFVRFQDAYANVMSKIWGAWAK